MCDFQHLMACDATYICCGYAYVAGMHIHMLVGLETGGLNRLETARLSRRPDSITCVP